MLALLFGIYSLGNEVFSKPGDAHYSFVPVSANYLVEVHTEAFLGQTTSDLLNIDEDSTLFRLLRNKLNETKWSDLSINGIDSRADVLLFLCEKEGETLFGQLLLIENEKKFRSHYLPTLDKNKKCAVIKGNVALLLSQSNEHFSPKELKDIAGNLLHGSHRNFDHEHGEGLIQVHSFSQVKVSNSTIRIRTEHEALHLDGFMQFNEEHISQDELRALKPDGFHFTSRIVPGFINELSDLELPIPLSGLSAVSMNYHGTEINTDRSPQVMPNVDLLLHFNKDVDLRTFLDSLERNALISRLQNGQFLCAGIPFYYRQITGKEMYIGRRTMGETQAFGKNEVFRVSGPIKDVANFKTSGLIGRLIEILPAYIATKEFAANCENLEMKGQVKGEEIKVLGHLNFKKGHHFTTELLRLLLLGKFM